MNKYKFLYLFWLVPLYLLLLTTHQAAVYYSVIDTYNNGDSYIAKVTDYNLKQIGAQNSAYVVLQFQTNDGKKHNRKLSLPFEMIHTVSESSVVPIRYRKGDFVNIVIMPAYDTQKELAFINAGIAFAGFLIAFVIAWFVHRFTRRKLHKGEKEMIIERIDDE